MLEGLLLYEQDLYGAFFTFDFRLVISFEISIFDFNQEFSHRCLKKNFLNLSYQQIMANFLRNQRFIKECFNRLRI